MSGLQFTLFDVTTLLEDSLSGLRKIIFRPGFRVFFVKYMLNACLQKTEPNLSEFGSTYDPKNLVKSKTRFKNSLKEHT